MKKSKIIVPKKTPGHEIAELIQPAMQAISVVPGVNVLSAIWSFWKDLCENSYEERRNSFLQELASKLLALEEKNDNFIESLKQDQEFLTLIYHAVGIAIGNHEEEKRKALVNMILNSATHNSPGKDLEMMFLLHLDTMTSWHLLLLQFLKDPRSFCQSENIAFQDYPEDYSGGVTIENVFPALESRREFYSFLITDLANRGMVHHGILSVAAKPEVPLNGSTTELGDQFLSFISSPASFKDSAL